MCNKVLVKSIQKINDRCIGRKLTLGFYFLKYPGSSSFICRDCLCDRIFSLCFLGKAKSKVAFFASPVDIEPSLGKKRSVISS